MTAATVTPVKPIALAAAAALAVAVLGGLMTDLGGWYEALQKPDWQPPGWVFPMVWTAIFAMAAVAGVLAWNGSHSKIARQNVLIVFLMNGVLNVTWSLLFFRLRRPDWALFEVFFLWASIVALIVACARRDRRTVWLLAPYLVWVTIAAVLNYEILRLNAVMLTG